MRTREFVRYADVAIEVIVEGQGPAIVLLPSLARDSEDYDAVAEGLAAAGYRALRPQPRGIGKSTGPLTGISLHDFARDIAEVIKALGGGRAVIAGHAYGNWIARMTAVDHPALVRGVVVLAAAAKQFPPELLTAINVAGNPALPEEQRLGSSALRLFRAGQRSESVARRLAPAVARTAARSGRSGQAVRLVVRRGCAAARFAGGARSVQAAGEAQRDEGRVRRAGSPSRSSRARAMR